MYMNVRTCHVEWTYVGFGRIAFIILHFTAVVIIHARFLSAIYTLTPFRSNTIVSITERVSVGSMYAEE